MKNLKQILKTLKAWYNLLRLDVVSESALMLAAVLLIVLFIQIKKKPNHEIKAKSYEKGPYETLISNSTDNKQSDTYLFESLL